MTVNETNYSRRSVLKTGVATGALGLVGTGATGTAAAGIGDGRVGHYNLNNLHMNPEKGVKERNHVGDASTYENHGTNEGGELVKDGGRVGNAFDFPTEEDRVLVPHSDSLSGMESLTVSIWVNIGQYTKDGVLIGGGTGTDNGLYELVVDDGSRCGEGSLWWAVANGEDWSVNCTGFEVETDTWVHLALVSDYDADEIRIYKNGGTPETKSGTDSVADRAQDIGIGARGDGWNGFVGMADEARIYDRALSDAEIQELASMGDD